MAESKAGNETRQGDIATYKYIVIGGGIAGVTCAETLSSLCPDEVILLLTASPLIKAVTNYRKVTKTLEEFDVEERPMFELSKTCPNVVVKRQKVTGLNSQLKTVLTEDHTTYRYNQLCLCTGGAPKVIAPDNPFVLGIRDTETVKVFRKRLCNARRIVVIGNGGIATELIYEIEGCEVVWAIKDDAISSTFIDAGAAAFFLPILQDKKQLKEGPMKRTKYTINDDAKSDTESSHRTSNTHDPALRPDSVNTHFPGSALVPDTHFPGSALGPDTHFPGSALGPDTRFPGSALGPDTHILGSALGPDWHEGLEMRGTQQESHKVHIVYEVELDRLLSPEELKHSEHRPLILPGGDQGASPVEWPVYVLLSNGAVYGCDFIVSATGVVPNIQPFVQDNQFSVCEDDGGINVDDKMNTSVVGVYSAGDVCHANWVRSEFWMQMRLWSQARQMGAYAAQCMVAHDKEQEISLDFCFEIFAHVTRFFNYKVVLLGKFNGQELGEDQELLVRVTKGVEYIKVVLKDGHIHGALMIGDTDMEETFENLILNQMDLTPFKDNLLNPNIDIEDFFD